MLQFSCFQRCELTCEQKQNCNSFTTVTDKTTMQQNNKAPRKEKKNEQITEDEKKTTKLNKWF